MFISLCDGDYGDTVVQNIDEFGIYCLRISPGCHGMAQLGILRTDVVQSSGNDCCMRSNRHDESINKLTRVEITLSTSLVSTCVAEVLPSSSLVEFQ